MGACTPNPYLSVNEVNRSVGIRAFNLVNSMSASLLCNVRFANRDDLVICCLEAPAPLTRKAVVGRVNFEAHDNSPKIKEILEVTMTVVALH
jgi:hypothetical protein